MKLHTGAFAAIAWFWMVCPLWAQTLGATIFLPEGSFLTSTHTAGGAEFRTQAKDLVVNESRIEFYKSSDPRMPPFAAALRSDLKPGVAVAPGKPDDLILFAWQPMGGWRSFVASGDKKELLAYLRSPAAPATAPLGRVGRAIPNDKPPQAVAWQIVSVFPATVAPEGVGEIRSLGPTVTNVRLAAADALWVILRFPAGHKKDLRGFAIEDGNGRSVGKLSAWVDAATVELRPDRSGQFLENPVLRQLKDQAAVARLSELVTGRLLPHAGAALLIFEGGGADLDGLSLRGEGNLVPLKPSPGNPLPSGPRTTGPANRSGGRAPASAAGKRPLPKAVSPVTKRQPQPQPPGFAETTAEQVRTWTAKTGDYTLRATLIDCQDGKVELRKEGGTTILVPLEKLCRPDQVYVRQRFKTSQDGGASGVPPASAGTGVGPRP